MPVKADLDVRQGNTFQVRFDMQDSSGVARSVATSTFVIRATARSGQLFRKSSANIGEGWTIPVPTNGQIFFSLSPAETRALPIDANATFEVEERMADGSQFTRVEGRLLVKPGINDEV